MALTLSNHSVPGAALPGKIRAFQARAIALILGSFFARLTGAKGGGQ